MDDALDRALSQLAATDFEYATESFEGLTNHGPMAAEALAALGHADRIDSFLQGYSPQLRTMPAAVAAPRRPVPLGEPDRVLDWLAHYDRELTGTQDWAAVLREALPALVPGLAAAAFHGLLRTAHAVRALETLDSPVRRHELAQGLAYWASQHHLLPGTPEAQPTTAAVRALDTVALVPADERITDGLIVERFAVLEHRAAFLAAVEGIALPEQLPALLSKLVARAARLIMVAAPGPAFVYLHTLTGTAGLRRLLPYLEPDRQRAAAGHLAQALMAVHATHGEPDSLARADALEGHSAPSPKQLAERASRSRDEHTVKLVEAALSEYAQTPAPELLWVAADRLDRAA